jgi:hypothetical protein
MVSSFPGLIAAAHVLHRLLAPRHPPCALILLIVKNTCLCHYGVFKVHAGLRPQRKNRPRGRSLKTQQRGQNTEVDVHLGELATRTAETINGRVTYRSNRSGIPRKEVIQPQLPLRLPCYDFTPIINPTFDGCLPCGLAHRLRVLPTFVV